MSAHRTCVGEHQPYCPMFGWPIEVENAGDARNIGYREGRLAAWEELREWAEENAGVARRVLERPTTAQDGP